LIEAALKDLESGLISEALIQLG
jgi:hypothetical protein